MAAELRAVSHCQDWRPEAGAWSFRFMAGHLAQVELDCYLNRVWRIAAGERPHYHYYTNAGWEFTHYEIGEWLFLWHGRRQELLEFVGTLSAAQRQLTGTHEHYGVMTIEEVLRLALTHDREHLTELQALREQCEGSERSAISGQRP